MSRNSSNPDKLPSNIFGIVSYEIGPDWYRLGRHLGLRDADLNNIDSDKKTSFEKADNVLKLWKQKHQINSWDQLKLVLESFERFDIVNLIERKCRDELVNQRNSSTHTVNGTTSS
ncbi:uncharacterized protein LOC136090131 [Hydra vulgaris]|uniref:Uncharacterized protein LOC136090131 n=1 Tax=Hydra vulgaris TaxID=6087 RepID=A0ABM4DD51_HYDVU